MSLHQGSSIQKCFLVAGQDPKKENLFYWKKQRYWAWSVERGCVTQEFRGVTEKDRQEDRWESAGVPGEGDGACGCRL